MKNSTKRKTPTQNLRCKFCRHPDISKIEPLIYQLADEGRGPKFILDAIKSDKRFRDTEGLTKTSLYSHCGWKKRKDGTYPRAHFDFEMPIQAYTNTMKKVIDGKLEESAKDYTSKMIVQKQIELGGLYLDEVLQQARENPQAVNPVFVTKALAMALDTEMKEKRLDLDREQGNERLQLLKGALQLGVARFQGRFGDQKKKPDTVDVEPVPPELIPSHAPAEA